MAGLSYFFLVFTDANFLVMPTEPTEPQSPQCGTSNKADITLSWLDPLLPNGDLKQYRINVYQQSSFSKTVNTSTTAKTFKVTGLEPGNSNIINKGVYSHDYFLSASN